MYAQHDVDARSRKGSVGIGIGTGVFGSARAPVLSQAPIHHRHHSTHQCISMQ
jgi:hypothetical protein